MATQIDMLKAEIARIERELQAVKRKLAEVQNGSRTKRSFADLRGIWKGADFTYEEIEAAEYKLDDEDHRV